MTQGPDINRTGAGILNTCFAFLCFTLMDAVLKWVGVRAPVAEEFFIATLVAAITVFAYGTRCGRDFAGLRTHYLKLHALRSVMFVAQFSLVIYSFRHMTLANFYALVFTAPLFITALSAVFLKEPVGWRRWTATAVGFAGVLIDLRPNGDMSIVSFYVLAATLLYSVDVIFMRIANRKDSTAATTFYVQALSLIPGGAYMAFTWQPVATGDIAWLCLAGVLCGIALMALVRGFRLASTPVAAPFHYTQLIWGLGIGWYIWQELPDVFTWIGGAVIVASGLYILHREAMVGRSKPAADSFSYTPATPNGG